MNIKDGKEVDKLITDIARQDSSSKSPKFIKVINLYADLITQLNLSTWYKTQLLSIIDEYADYKNELSKFSGKHVANIKKVLIACLLLIHFMDFDRKYKFNDFFDLYSIAFPGEQIFIRQKRLSTEKD